MSTRPQASLLAAIEQEERDFRAKRGFDPWPTELSQPVQDEIGRCVMKEIVDQGLNAVKSFLGAS
jgi:hypothetical protein